MVVSATVFCRAGLCCFGILPAWLLIVSAARSISARGAGTGCRSRTVVRVRLTIARMTSRCLFPPCRAVCALAAMIDARLRYRIEGGCVGRLTGRRLPFALRVFRSDGPGLFDWSSVHLSTAKSRATLRRRVARLFPSAVPEGRP